MTREAGSLPAPRVCIDEDGVLPEDFVRQEKARLETALRPQEGGELIFE